MPKLNYWQWLSIAISLLMFSFFGWTFAIVMVVGIAVHEYSHLIAAEKLGLETKGFWLLPFGGVSIYGRCRTLWHQAIVSLAGPFGGTIVCIASIAVYWITRSPCFAVAAFWMALFNFGNMLPLSPILDGGQAMDCITYSISRKIGVGISIALSVIGTTITSLSLPIFSIMLFAISMLICWSELNNQKYESLGLYDACSKSYLNKQFPMNKGQMWKAALIWLATTLILVLVCAYVWHIGLSSPRLLFKTTP